MFTEIQSKSSTQTFNCAAREREREIFFFFGGGGLLLFAMLQATIQSAWLQALWSSQDLLHSTMAAIDNYFDPNIIPHVI